MPTYSPVDLHIGIWYNPKDLGKETYVMASLTETLTKNKPLTKLGGELFAGGQTVDKAVQTAQQGVIPNSPLSAATVGAKPDAAKMVGTRAQQQAAAQKTPSASFPMQLQIEETKLLDWQDKIKKDPRQLTALEQDAVRTAEALNPNLGSFAGRVPQLAVKAAFGALGAGKAQVNQAAVDTYAQAQRTAGREIRSDELTTDLNRVLANPTDLKAMTDLWSKYGIENPQELIGMITASGGADAARQILDPDSVTMDKITAGMDEARLKAELGMDSAELEKIFGKDWKSKSWGQLKGTLGQVASAQTSTRDLMAILNNPTIGQTQRSAARRALVELGAIGVRTAEEKVNNIMAQMEDGDQLLVDGRAMEIEEVLKDDFLSTRITEAMNDPTGQKLKEMEQWAPELAAWVKQNQVALKDASSKVDTTLQNVKDIQAFNKSLSNIPGVRETLSDATMKVIDPTWGQPSTEKKDLSKSRIYSHIMNLQGVEREKFVSNLNKLSSVLTPQQVQELLSTSPDIDKLKKNGWLGDDRVNKVLTKAKDINEFDVNYGGNPDALINKLFGTSGIQARNTSDLVNQLKDPYIMEALNKGSYMYELDVNRDGKFSAEDLADPVKLASHVKKYISRAGVGAGPTLDEVAKQINEQVVRLKKRADTTKAEDDKIKSKVPQTNVEGYWRSGGEALPSIGISDKDTQVTIEAEIARQIRRKEQQLLSVAKDGFKYRTPTVDISQYLKDFEARLRGAYKSAWDAKYPQTKPTAAPKPAVDRPSQAEKNPEQEWVRSLDRVETKVTSGGSSTENRGAGRKDRGDK